MKCRRCGADIDITITTGKNVGLCLFSDYSIRVGIVCKSCFSFNEKDYTTPGTKKLSSALEGLTTNDIALIIVALNHIRATTYSIREVSTEDDKISPLIEKLKKMETHQVNRNNGETT